MGEQKILLLSHEPLLSAPLTGGFFVNLPYLVNAGALLKQFPGQSARWSDL
jgi:hypothetical protein